MTCPNMSTTLLSSNDLQRIFKKLDKNGDGLVSLDELNWLLEKIGVRYSLEELESLVGKSCLKFHEFVFFYDSINSEHKYCKGENIDEGDEEEEYDLFKAFKVFDLNGDGYISCDELESVLSRLELWEENCGRDGKRMIHVYDTNMDGKLDFEEFKSMMWLTIS